MSCSNYEWKAYVLGEMSASDRREAESHAANCSTCREEVAATRLTLDALSTMRMEEPPRRIAFVSDKVFEPRWWQAIFKPSFAGAMAIALAILAHGFMSYGSLRPDATLQARIDASVTRAVADADQRHTRELEQLLSDYDISKKESMLMYAKSAGIVRQ